MKLVIYLFSMFLRRQGTQQAIEMSAWLGSQRPDETGQQVVNLAAAVLQLRRRPNQLYVLRRDAPLNRKEFQDHMRLLYHLHIKIV